MFIVWEQYLDDLYYSGSQPGASANLQGEGAQDPSGHNKH